ncbi:reverse transcriptase domain-containing protein [Tanacetum coccineum]
MQIQNTLNNHLRYWESVCRRNIPCFFQRLGILQAFTSVYHPQANGQVEVTKRDIVKGMERRLGKTYQGWVDELPQVLWAHRTTLKSNNRETPFSLVYGSEVVVPIEISIETKRIQDFDVKQNEKRRTYVLKLNSASKVEFQGKMGPTWEGPYIVKKAYGDGAYKIETLYGSSN